MNSLIYILARSLALTAIDISFLLACQNLFITSSVAVDYILLLVCKQQYSHNIIDE